MAAAAAPPPPAEASLESLINKATNPVNKDNDWESIKAFWDQLNNEAEGPQLATRLLAHKIQSPQEWEALQALTLLETCMKNCGKRFHTEVAKFRFLNELIKVVSPKYLGSRAPEPVKKKVLEVMYSWTLGLPDETKIVDAYQMLKKQGIVKQDPVLPNDTPLPPPAPRVTSAVFEDEEKSKMLSRLLNSSHQEDLRAANKLIKEMVQEDQKRTEKVSKRLNAIQEVKESVSLLGQLLEGYSKDSVSHSNQELIKANDSLTQVINLYRQLVKGEEMNGETTASRSLPGLDTSPSNPPPVQDPTVSLLDDELMSLGFTEVMPNSISIPQLGDFNTFQSCDGAEPAARVLLPAMALSPHPPAAEAPAASPTSLDELDLLGKTLLRQSLPPESQQVKWDKFQSQSKLTLRDLQTKSNNNHHNSSGAPSSLLPVTVFDKHSFRVLFHFARDCPRSRPDVLVVIISMLSSAPLPINNIRFQSAVPKVMKVKLHPPSGTDLPAFNPILPPAAITQILLLANPQKDKVRLRYKLTFNLGNKAHDESGDVEQFPPPDSWGNL
ncbi:hypothetical protein CRUP_036947 [Coryphaenoides rupestris]|nr:hypothetical protein CRUP_036947 [Coryphaenoides rupestris]